VTGSVDMSAALEAAVLPVLGRIPVQAPQLRNQPLLLVEGATLLFLIPGLCLSPPPPPACAGQLSCSGWPAWLVGGSPLQPRRWPGPWTEQRVSPGLPVASTGEWASCTVVVSSWPSLCQTL